MHMFTAALFTIGKTWNQPKYSVMLDWTRKMWHMYTMEYYAAIKNDEFMSFVGTWMNLETIILSKLTQEQKINHCMFSPIGNCWTARMHGHREESITHWGLLWGISKGQQAVGGLGGIPWGEMPDIGDRRMEAANHIAMYVHMQQSCIICTCTPEPKVQ